MKNVSMNRWIMNKKFMNGWIEILNKEFMNGWIEMINQGRMNDWKLERINKWMNE